MKEGAIVFLEGESIDLAHEAGGPSLVPRSQRRWCGEGRSVAGILRSKVSEPKGNSWGIAYGHVKLCAV